MPDAVLTVQPPSCYRSVIFGATPESLLQIRQATVSLAVWERSMPVELARWLDQVPPETLPAARFICRATEARRRVMEAFAGHARESCAERLLLQEDIIGEVERFAQICDARTIEVRLEVINDDACSKFHADNIPVRLLTTYRGPATEWLDPAVEFDACCAAHAPETAVRRLSRFAVALIKGHTAGDRSGPLVLHRSPPIEGSGQTRFFLCVNQPASDRTSDQC